MGDATTKENSGTISRLEKMACCFDLNLLAAGSQRLRQLWHLGQRIHPIAFIWVIPAVLLSKSGSFEKEGADFWIITFNHSKRGLGCHPPSNLCALGLTTRQFYSVWKSILSVSKNILLIDAPITSLKVLDLDCKKIIAGRKSWTC